MNDHQPYQDNRTDEDIKESNDSILKTVNDICQKETRKQLQDFETMKRNNIKLGDK